MITVAGGVYIEKCLYPNDTENTFGSGGRAAQALRQTGLKVDLHLFAPDTAQRSVEGSFLGTGIILRRTSSEQLYEFVYRHALAQPCVSPWPPEDPKHAIVSAPLVLRYGAIEGDFKVQADVAIYDPQSPDKPAHFRANGSTAKQLAIILNRQELIAFGGVDELDAVRTLIKADQADVVVVKNGAYGANVYNAGGLLTRVPPLETIRISKIGTGDIFSAAFAYWWGHKKESPVDAAMKASKCVAAFCESQVLNFNVAINYPFHAAPDPKPEKTIYLAGPFFSTGQFLLVDEAAHLIQKLGGKVFSPYHHVGKGSPSYVVPKDLEGLDNAATVLAIVDGNDAGTLFEVGYARAHDIPVVALAESPKGHDLTMLIGTDCEIVEDLCTAVYRAIWSSWR
ncbi:MAG: PfkB family carbohydrate kinase [Hyphomonadaceae bacterium]